MADITALLKAAGQGDDRAGEEVIAQLYQTLRTMARSRMRRSGDITLLDTTSLVHECYLRLERADELDFDDRRHYLAYASKVMHAIVIDMVRARQAERRGGDSAHIELTTGIADSLPGSADEVLRVHEALEELAQADARLAQVVEMRYFGGLAESEIAECLGITERTVQRDWRKARLFLLDALK
jgi:RNA polymerase sigma factor (TIGR02999 family)